MDIQDVSVPFGSSMPPQGAHTVTTYMPGWDNAMAIREGDKNLMARIKSLYPRFMPMGPARELASALLTKLDMPPPAHNIFMFTDPAMLSFSAENATSHHRGEARLANIDKLVFKAVSIRSSTATSSADTDTITLYLVIFPMQLTPAVIGGWQNPGTGVSTRLAEYLLPKVLETGFEEHEVSVIAVDPTNNNNNDDGGSSYKTITSPSHPPTFLPETSAHSKLKSRIQSLLLRGVDGVELEAAEKVKDSDIFFGPSGMAAIWAAHRVFQKHRAGNVLVLGAVFHSTWHVFSEAKCGFKHFGDVTTDTFLSELAEWMNGEKTAGREISYVFVEVASNPICMCVDVKGLSELCLANSIPLVIDDTIASIGNSALLSHATALVSSLTKTFSGYADVMAGSLILNPLSPFYPVLSPLSQSLIRNEFFSLDAEALLKNSENYLTRTVTLNRNASALASYLSSCIRSAGENADSPIIRVLHASLGPTKSNYAAILRKPTPFTSQEGNEGDGQEMTSVPGHGCLLSVDFSSMSCTKAFYEELGRYFYPGPHLGAHKSLVLCYNALVYSGKSEDAEYHAGYGLTQTQIRISVGLEPEEELIEAIKRGIVKAKEAM